MSEFIHHSIQYILDLVSTLGYFGIFILMTLESTLVPIPSEAVLIPAGYHVASGQMNGALVVIAGVLGSVSGALINYVLALWLGRPLILKIGHYLLLPEARFVKAERAFLKHSRFVTFVGRLIFGVRHWISIPAGLTKMPILPFVTLTAAGSGIWTVILVAFGYSIGVGEQSQKLAHTVGYWLIGAVIVMTAAYVMWGRTQRNSAAEAVLSE